MEDPDEDWEWYFSSNFNVAVRFITYLIPHLKKTKGTITLINSMRMKDIGAPLPYSSSKAAMAMYAKGLSRKLAEDRIRVNTVVPGNILFPGGNWDKKQKANPKMIREFLEAKVPLKQFGSPEDIGNIVAFVVSDKAKFITGSCFVVDGGQTTLFL